MEVSINILMLYPRFSQEAFWSLGRSARYFLRRRAVMPPLGLLSVASELPDDFQVRLIDRNVSEETEADWQWADVVFLSLMLAQREDYRVCVSKAGAYRKPIAVGGPFTHAMPEIAIADADWVCLAKRKPSWKSSSAICALTAAGNNIREATAPIWSR